MKKKILIKNLRITRRMMYCALAFVLISITTMTLAYAALSTTLTITGTAEFKEANFGMKVEELPISNLNAEFVESYFGSGNISGNVITYGKGTLLNKPTISGTSINNYRISLTKPGDNVSMLYKITNIGNIPILFNEPIWLDHEFSSSNNSQEDIQLLQNEFYIHYNYINIVEENDLWIPVSPFNGILCVGQTLMIDISNGYDYDATAVPSSNITVSNLGIQINAQAADLSICE